MAVGAPVSIADPEYYESVQDGNVFSATTALTGVAPGTSVSTTAAFALTNPIGSGVDLVILEGSFGYVSGTLGAGVITWNANIDDELALPTGTAINEINMKFGNGTAAVGRALTTATIAVPIPVRIMGNLQASLATTAVAGWQLKDEVRGAIVVPPGCTVSLHATAAAGSTPLGIFSVLWKEQNRA